MSIISSSTDPTITLYVTALVNQMGGAAIIDDAELARAGMCDLEAYWEQDPRRLVLKVKEKGDGPTQPVQPRFQ